MKPLAALIVSLALAGPALAQTLDTLLPTPSWPEGGITTSTKGCAVPATPTKCQTGQ